jgi:hypothetical protein
MSRLITLAAAAILLVGGMAVAYSHWTEAGRAGKPVTAMRGATVNMRGVLHTADRHSEFDPPTASGLGHFDQFGGFIPSGPAGPPRSAEVKVKR